MPSTVNFSKNYLIAGVCLPLAVLLGYLLAEPMQSASMAVVVLVFGTLSIPLFLRWHHPLLVFSWNACISPYFLPGQPMLWMLMAIMGFFYAILIRATDSNRSFISVPSVTRALAVVVLVVGVTAYFTGGAGLNIVGSSVFGGRFYISLLLAIVGYFALTSQRVAPGQVDTYVACFFLSGMTAVVSNLAYLAGPKFYYLFWLFPPGEAMSQAQADYSIAPMAARITGLGTASVAVWQFMLARQGIRGVLDFSKPWRVVFLLVAVAASLMGGFRSAMIQFVLLFAVLFYLERLWRTRLMLLVVAGGLTLGVGLVLFADKLPLAMQRSVSFLPVNIDPIARLDAEASTTWRVEMWKTMLPEIPHYFFLGKGYALDPQDLNLMQESVMRGYENSYGVARLAGDYHSGPLSIIIPFGVWGVMAFGWFFFAGWRVLVHNHRYSPPNLGRINCFLLALYVAKLVYFILIFGSIYAELYQFTGLIGLSLALNGGVRRADEAPPADLVTD